ncbi:hypothetical protein VHUM_04170 [Vanrija humicola]|uniref:AB hydrolase-1 domain-containing protein n=1 Tax=Vanrija humicola TaxID=5417 RepID=A0A7D8YUD3_VANHU|nr:hypothetical protein VHUM_04170 [Vanrija humicola]
MSLAGTLSLYPRPGSSWERRPYFSSGDENAARAVVFIGGLFSGMLDAPFLPRLSRALGDAGWRLVQIHWSSAYDGFGTGSLDRDCDELESLVAHLRTLGVHTVVLMGHSTGSQAVLRYLSKAGRSEVQGGILQSPASDREFFAADPDDTNVWKQYLPHAETLIAAGKGDHLLDDKFTAETSIRMTAYRLHSLVGLGGDDDYFSSDLPDVPDDSVHIHPLSSSFGKLSAPALALWCEKDHCAVLPDQTPLLRRWEAASQGKLEWRILLGASHTVDEGDAQEAMCSHVVTWLHRFHT